VHLSCRLAWQGRTSWAAGTVASPLLLGPLVRSKLFVDLTTVLYEMRHLLLTFAVLWCSAVAQDDDYNHWIVPTEPGPSNNFGANLVWSEDSVVTLEWNVSLSYYEIDLYQQKLDPPSGVRIYTIFCE
jgi:hypothetical protein